MSWDAKIANAAVMADRCMSLGAVILKPASRPPVGFTPSKEKP